MIVQHNSYPFSDIGTGYPRPGPHAIAIHVHQDDVPAGVGATLRTDGCFRFVNDSASELGFALEMIEAIKFFLGTSGVGESFRYITK